MVSVHCSWSVLPVDLALTANNEIIAEKSEVYEGSAIICNVVLICLLACLGNIC